MRPLVLAAVAPLAAHVQDDGDPLVVIRNAPSGLYDIGVGTCGSRNDSATLLVSDVDPR